MPIASITEVFVALFVDGERFDQGIVARNHSQRWLGCAWRWPGGMRARTDGLESKPRARV